MCPYVLRPALALPSLAGCMEKYRHAQINRRRTSRHHDSHHGQPQWVCGGRTSRTQRCCGRAGMGTRALGMVWESLGVDPRALVLEREALS
jgi:hypothetical protein